MSIFLWHDKLRQEFISYYHFLQAKNSEELLQESEDALNYDEIDEEEIDEDYDDYLLEEWNNYVNGIWDNEYYVKYNVDKDTSNQLKLMVMVSLYEFVATNYECASDIERIIYDLLINDITPLNAVKLYDEYYQYVLESFSYFMHDNVSCNNHRLKIIDNNLTDNVLKINPASILDYRMLYGLKFDDEDISSVRMGKMLIEMVEQANLMVSNGHFQNVYDAIKYIIDDSMDLRIYVNSNWEYMLSNYYEHLLIKNKYDRYEKEFINLYENDIQKLYMEFYDSDNYCEKLIYEFYILNRDKFSEKYLYDLRCHTESKGKDKVLALKISPYYIEEQSYFKNKY